MEIERQNFNGALTGSNSIPDARTGSMKTGNCNTVKMVTGKPFGISKNRSKNNVDNHSGRTRGNQKLERAPKRPDDNAHDVYAGLLEWNKSTNDF